MSEETSICIMHSDHHLPNQPGVPAMAEPQSREKRAWLNLSIFLDPVQTHANESF